jgi:hypothetical protein
MNYDYALLLLFVWQLLFGLVHDYLSQILINLVDKLKINCLG